MKEIKKIKISSNKLSELKRSSLAHFPLYTTYLINQASQTAHATRPRVVGQLSDEFPKYEQEAISKGEQISLDGWKEYHLRNYPNALNEARERITKMIDGFKEAIELIDEEMITEWVEDLLYDKTYYGFNVEGVIKLFLEDKGLDVKDATAEDEGKNIDLYIDGKPYQIKPDSIEHKQSIKSTIDIPIIVYRKDGNSIIIEFNDDELYGKIK